MQLVTETTVVDNMNGSNVGEQWSLDVSIRWGKLKNNWSICSIEWSKYKMTIL